MEKSKKLIMALIILLLIIGILVIILICHRNGLNAEENNEVNEIVTSSDIFEQVKDYETYYTVKQIIDNYIIYMKQVNGDEYIEMGKLSMTKEEIESVMQNEGITAIKNILDEQYLNELNITDDQIITMQNEYRKNGNYDKNTDYNLNIKDIVIYDISEDIKIALVDAQIDDEDFNIMIKMDKVNNTYSIFLSDYIDKYNYNKNMDKTNININDKSIEKNSYNGNINVKATETYVVSQYFSEYRMKMLNNTLEAYNLLDTEYAEKKYGSYENFKEYVDSHIDEIKYSSISKYQVTETDGIKEYVCIDKNGKYYIFMEESVLKYKVVLDTYTIDLPEFLEKYKNDNQIKVGMNIQKVFDAINDGDYTYVYNKLDETFKNTNFADEKAFEDYVKQNFSNNQLEYENCKNDR